MLHIISVNLSKLRGAVQTVDSNGVQSILKMIPEWFKDYNEVAPHSALGMLSPIEYSEKVS